MSLILIFLKISFEFLGEYLNDTFNISIQLMLFLFLTFSIFFMISKYFFISLLFLVIFAKIIKLDFLLICMYSNFLKSFIAGEFALFPIAASAGLELRADTGVCICEYGHWAVA